MCTKSGLNVSASNARRILMVNIAAVAAGAFFSMNLILWMCRHSFHLSALRIVSTPYSSPSSLQNWIPLNNAGDMQSTFIMNAHPHHPLTMLSRMPKKLLQLSLSSAFTSESNISICFWMTPDLVFRFQNRSLHYEDCYCKGLNGCEAAWASRHYRSHCALPPEATREVISELMKHVQ